MSITNESIAKLLSDLSNLEIIESGDIPDIDLYMDQLTTFMENKLQGYKRGDEDKIITKTMINNYTKSKVLPVPNKKKYSVDQIAMLIMIYHMKPVLSLNDISILLRSDASLSSAELFEVFTMLQQKNKEGVEESVTQKVREIEEMGAAGNNENTGMLLLALSFVLEAGMNKLIAEKIIDSILRKPIKKEAMK